MGLAEFVQKKKFQATKKEIQNKYNKDKFGTQQVSSMDRVQTQLENLQNAPKKVKTVSKIPPEQQQENDDRNRMDEHESDLDNMIKRNQPKNSPTIYHQNESSNNQQNNTHDNNDEDNNDNEG